MPLACICYHALSGWPGDSRSLCVDTYAYQQACAGAALKVKLHPICQQLPFFIHLGSSLAAAFVHTTLSSCVVQCDARELFASLGINNTRRDANEAFVKRTRVLFFFSRSLTYIMCERSNGRRNAAIARHSGSCRDNGGSFTVSSQFCTKKKLTSLR